MTSWLVIRRQILDRDEYRCQNPKCGTSDDLEVHHIIPSYLGGSDEPENLKTLCFKCHWEEQNQIYATPKPSPKRTIEINGKERLLLTDPLYKRIDSCGKIYIRKALAGVEILAITFKPLPEDKINYIKVGRD